MCLFISDQKQELRFAFTLNHTVYLDLNGRFKCSTSIKNIKQCARNVLLLWFALVLFVKTGKLGFLLSSCAILYVLLSRVFTCMYEIQTKQ